jgi:hypothetical protein
MVRTQHACMHKRSQRGQGIGLGAARDDATAHNSCLRLSECVGIDDCTAMAEEGQVAA